MGYFTLATLTVYMVVITMKVEAQTSLEDRVQALERDITALKSSSHTSVKKLRRQLKRELRNKIVPKIMKTISKSMSDTVKKTVDDAVVQLEQTRKGASADDMLAMFNHVQSRMKTIEEENAVLKKALKTTSADFENKLIQFQDELSENCNCQVTLLNVAPANLTLSSGFRVPEMIPEKIPPKPVPVEYLNTRNSSRSGESTRMSVIDLKEDLTFNVSVGTPGFENDDSLLVVDDDGNMSRISLRNSSVRGTMETESYVEGITFDSVSRKLFWGSNRAQHKAVYSVGLDGADLTKLQDGKWAFSLAVDGKRRKLFISEWSTKTICVMSTSGQNYKLVTDYDDDGDPRNILLDPERRLIYVSYSFSIVKMKYDGSRIKRLAEGVWMQPITFDIVRNTLYYSIKRNIYKIDLSSSKKSARFVNQLDLDLSTMVFHRNKLYIAYQSWVPPVDVLDLHGNTLTRFAGVETDTLLRLCIIPA